MDEKDLYFYGFFGWLVILFILALIYQHTGTRLNEIQRRTKRK